MAEVKFDHGCSGGPVFSARTGKVIGVAVAGIPLDHDMDYNKGLFVPVSAIESFIAPLTKNTPHSRKPKPVILANSQTAPTIDAAAEIATLFEPIPEPGSSHAQHTNAAPRGGIFLSPEQAGQTKAPSRAIILLEEHE